MKRLVLLISVLAVVFSVRFVLAQTCDADFIFDANCPTQFTDQSTSGTGVVNFWNWSFGDGNASNLQNPSHTYGANGTYSVVLEVWTSDTCQSFAVETVTVNCVPVELQSLSVE